MTYTEAMTKAREAALATKPEPWWTCPHCGAHQSQEVAPLAICFLCQRSMLERGENE